jgi:hypothetical protein
VKCVPNFLSTAPPKKQKIHIYIDCKGDKKNLTAESFEFGGFFSSYNNGHKFEKVNKENNSDAKDPTVDDYIPMESTANFKVKMSSELVKN